MRSYQPQSTQTASHWPVLVYFSYTDGNKLRHVLPVGHCCQLSQLPLLFINLTVNGWCAPPVWFPCVTGAQHCESSAT
jgi:hypothetical protein